MYILLEGEAKYQDESIIIGSYHLFKFNSVEFNLLMANKLKYEYDLIIFSLRATKS